MQIVRNKQPEPKRNQISGTEFAGGSFSLMVWALPVPDIAISPLDTRPIAAVVEQAQDHTMVSQIEEISRVHVADIELQRREMRLRFHAVFAALLAAEQDGWAFDCSQMLAKLSDALATCRPMVQQAKDGLSRVVRTAVDARLPGSNRVGNYRDKIQRTLCGWIDDLDDYHAELSEIGKRMAAVKERAPVVRAVAAYKTAIKQVLSADVEPETQIDLSYSEPAVWFTVPVSPEYRMDRKTRRAAEHQIHDMVAKIDSDLVGLVAIQYSSQGVAA